MPARINERNKTMHTKHIAHNFFLFFFFFSKFSKIYVVIRNALLQTKYPERIGYMMEKSPHRH